MICDRKNKNFKCNYCIFFAGTLFLGGSAGLRYASVKQSGFSDWYCEKIYTGLVNFIGRIMGKIPFSVVEILLYLLILVLIADIIRQLIIRKKAYAYAFAARIFLAVATLIFLYEAGCGVNYYRASFSSCAGIEIEDYSSDDLQEVCVWLTNQVNQTIDGTTRDSDGVFMIDAKSARSEASDAMSDLGDSYSCLEGYYPLPKQILVSEILSYQELTGVYSPFTIEANYNGDMPAYNKPFTMCHELSHLRGFMSEKEANFIAFLACTQSESAEFEYSGYLSGWVYCMNLLYKLDHDKWKTVRAGLDARAEKDLEVNNTFWDSYRGKVSEIQNNVNNNYLKANGQSEGVRGYDRMVDLVVAYYKTK